MSLRRPTPPGKGCSAPEEEEEETYSTTGKSGLDSQRRQRCFSSSDHLYPLHPPQSVACTSVKWKVIEREIT